MKENLKGASPSSLWVSLLITILSFLSPSAYCQDETFILTGNMVVNSPSLIPGTFIPVDGAYHLGYFKIPVAATGNGTSDNSVSQENPHFIDEYGFALSEKFLNDINDPDFNIPAQLKIDNWQNGAFLLYLATHDKLGIDKMGRKSIWISPCDITVDSNSVAFNINNLKGDVNWMLISNEGMFAYLSYSQKSIVMKFDEVSSDKANSFISALRRNKSEKIKIIRDSNSGTPERGLAAKRKPTDNSQTKTVLSVVNTTSRTVTLPKMLTTVADFGKFGEKMTAVRDKVSSEGYKFRHTDGKSLMVAFCSPEAGMKPELKNEITFKISGFPDKYTEAIVSYYVNSKGKLCTEYTFWFERQETSAFDSMEFLSALRKEMNSLGYGFDISVEKLEDIQMSKSSLYGEAVICRQENKGQDGKTIYGASLYVVNP